VKVINGFSVWLHGISPAGVKSVIANVYEDGSQPTAVGDPAIGKDQRRRVSEHVLKSDTETSK